ncbi:MAG: hypothetical protein ACTSUT_02875 [Promethearchaeota archaeon]
MEEKEHFQYMTIKEIIDLLAETRTDVKLLKYQCDLATVKKEIKSILNKIDIVGCELTQNIAKKLE